MSQSTHPVLRLVQEDPRYRLEAYAFLFEALKYAQEELSLGSDEPSESAADKPDPEERKRKQKHLTGRQLCDAIRLYALEQYGYMAKCVLNSWGVQTTGDFGEMVYNLIRIGEMRKTRRDRREDFDAVYDFDEAFCQNFRMALPE